MAGATAPAFSLALGLAARAQEGQLQAPHRTSSLRRFLSLQTAYNLALKLYRLPVCAARRRPWRLLRTELGYGSGVMLAAAQRVAAAGAYGVHQVSTWGATAGWWNARAPGLPLPPAEDSLRPARRDVPRLPIVGLRAHLLVLPAAVAFRRVTAVRRRRARGGGRGWR